MHSYFKDIKIGKKYIIKSMICGICPDLPAKSHPFFTGLSNKWLQVEFLKQIFVLFCLFAFRDGVLPSCPGKSQTLELK
jgi:hypothetical protein